MVMQTIGISMKGKLKLLENGHNWGKKVLSPGSLDSIGEETMGGFLGTPLIVV